MDSEKDSNKVSSKDLSKDPNKDSAPVNADDTPQKRVTIVFVSKQTAAGQSEAPGPTNVVNPDDAPAVPGPSAAASVAVTPVAEVSAADAHTEALAGASAKASVAEPAEATAKPKRKRKSRAKAKAKAEANEDGGGDLVDVTNVPDQGNSNAPAPGKKRRAAKPRKKAGTTANLGADKASASASASAANNDAVPTGENQEASAAPKRSKGKGKAKEKATAEPNPAEPMSVETNLPARKDKANDKGKGKENSPPVVGAFPPFGALFGQGHAHSVTASANNALEGIPGPSNLARHLANLQGVSKEALAESFAQWSVQTLETILKQDANGSSVAVPAGPASAATPVLRHAPQPIPVQMIEPVHSVQPIVPVVETVESVEPVVSGQTGQTGKPSETPRAHATFGPFPASSPPAPNLVRHTTVEHVHPPLPETNTNPMRTLDEDAAYYLMTGPGIIEENELLRMRDRFHKGMDGGPYAFKRKRSTVVDPHGDVHLTIMDGPDRIRHTFQVNSTVLSMCSETWRHLFHAFMRCNMIELPFDAQFQHVVKRCKEAVLPDMGIEEVRPGDYLFARRFLGHYRDPVNEKHIQDTLRLLGAVARDAATAGNSGAGQSSVVEDNVVDNHSEGVCDNDDNDDGSDNDKNVVDRAFDLFDDSIEDTIYSDSVARFGRAEEDEPQHFKEALDAYLEAKEATARHEAEAAARDAETLAVIRETYDGPGVVTFPWPADFFVYVEAPWEHLCCGNHIWLPRDEQEATTVRGRVAFDISSLFEDSGSMLDPGPNQRNVIWAMHVLLEVAHGNVHACPTRLDAAHLAMLGRLTRELKMGVVMYRTLLPLYVRFHLQHRNEIQDMFADLAKKQAKKGAKRNGKAKKDKGKGKVDPSPAGPSSSK
ncbi:hypothetical protein SPBR_01343 [Sporothrix brasiliensis 5110]|uniref:Uncharacterized protein n=1 Tax=Sporothrix brasiliensis 5110 TaxID=1398154 RepID=A0A0C2J1P6_9PEZI|nr:uncharacterized protein SPBR_01343 [Sporothrix brasiliensis 5110]KIH91022.1 hypothetical protein SPBR_01343 [Sporothrix brasiliensis 5110]